MQPAARLDRARRITGVAANPGADCSGRKMNLPSAKMLVLAGNSFFCIKIIGRANFNSSVDFRTLINELRSKGCARFILELSECALMDSTFLGVLTGFG